MAAFLLEAASVRLSADDAPSAAEMKIFDLIGDAVENLLNMSLDDMKTLVKKGGKDAPKLLESESRPAAGYFVYTDGRKRFHFHAGKMLRLDQPGLKGMSDVVKNKLNTALRKGARFDSEQLEKGDQIVHLDLTTKIERAGVLYPFTYTLQFTTRGSGSVVCTVLNLELFEAFRKASAPAKMK